MSQITKKREGGEREREKRERERWGERVRERERERERPFYLPTSALLPLPLEVHFWKTRFSVFPFTLLFVKGNEDIWPLWPLWER